MNFRKIFSSVLACTLVVSAMSFNAYGINKDELDKIDIGDIKLPDPADGCEFTLKEDGTYEISGHEKVTGTSASYAIKLPSTYNGKPVTSIGDRAFAYDGHIDFFNISTFIIPEGITSIGDRAFRGCKMLSEIEIPSSVTHIGEEAFGETPWIESKRTQNPCVVVNNILIDGKAAAGDVIIPSGVTSMSKFAFDKNESITSVKIPSSIKTISKYAFCDCTALTSVDLPKTLTSIEDGAFDGCTALTSINLPKTLTGIGEYAFDHCSITEITLPTGLKTIGKGAFWACEELTEITIPKGVETIPNYAFSICLNLKSVNISNGVKNIGDKAFAECRELKSITIPESVVSLGNEAFLYTILNTITIKNPKCVIDDANGTIPWYATIYGYSGSTAEDYAKKHSNKFVLIGLVGDANGDGEVTIKDSVFIAKMCAKGTRDKIPACADYNGDGQCSIKDAVDIAKFIAREKLQKK